jgi:hypothetical protein
VARSVRSEGWVPRLDARHRLEVEAFKVWEDTMSKGMLQVGSGPRGALLPCCLTARDVEATLRGFVLGETSGEGLLPDLAHHRGVG